METKQKLVVFTLDERFFALHLSNVERIIPTLEMQTVSSAPDYIAGSINYQGDFLPVVDLRKVFQIPEREPELSDRLLITANTRIKVALIVDSIQEIAERSENEIKSPKNLMLDVEHIDGLFELDEGMVLIHDLDKFLTDDQVKLIMDAMKKTKNGADRTKGRVKKST